MNKRVTVPRIRPILNGFLALILFAAGCGKNESRLSQLEAKARAGDRQAQYTLGDLYSQGKTVTRNGIKAFQWYSKAAQQGHVLSQSVIGTMYILGEGVPEDLVLAYQWLDIAAANHDLDALVNRARLDGKLTPEQIAEAKRRAAEFRARHAIVKKE